MEDFFERIDVKSSLSEIAREMCLKCGINDYISSQIVEVGYEDFNFILETKEQKYFVKIFNKDRTREDCSNYMDRINLSNTIDINTPKTMFFDTIRIDNKDLKFVIFEYINGKSFLDLEQIPNETEIKEIIRQMANMHKTKLDSKFIYDMWTITNFTNEFNQKSQLLDKEYYDKFSELSDKLQNVDISKLPHSFVHGDIISSNVIKDNNNKLWIIDFAVSNYLPRIIDLVVTGDNLCLDSESKENTIKNFKIIISEYEKYNKLTDYEKEILPLFYDIGNAMGILQINYLKNNEGFSKEDKYWLNISQKGLEYSDYEFWTEVLYDNRIHNNGQLFQPPFLDKENYFYK